MKKILALFIVLISWQVYGQRLEWLKLKPYRIAQLNKTLKENSALEFRNGKLFTLNDSGNTPDLFEIDVMDGHIVNVIPTGLQNKDWEALASDGISFFIGDVGNNNGDRKDLTVYKWTDSATVALPYFYPEQSDFTSSPLATDFDAEAMIHLNGSLHIFTKEWLSKGTTHYILKLESEEKQAAQKAEYVHLGFAVTDAAYHEGYLYLVGYTRKADVYMSVFKETEPGVFFGEKGRKFYLGSSLTIGQIEGIAVNEKGIYISGEELTIPIFKVKPYFYFIPAEKVQPLP